MAIKDDDLDLETVEDGAGAKKSGSKKIILLSVGIILLLAITIGATLFFTGVFDSTDEMQADGTDTQNQSAEKQTAKQVEDNEPEDKTLVFYHAFDPAFVVNFEDKGTVHYLQLGISVMTHKESVLAELKKHDPVLRNNLVLLLSSQDYQSLSTREGKEILRNKVRGEIQKVLKKYANSKGIEEAFFTSFVIQ